MMSGDEENIVGVDETDMASFDFDQASELTSHEQFEVIGKEIASLKNEITQASKMRSIEWAIDNTESFGSFEYRHATVKPGTVYKSPQFVRSVLMWFRKGQGTFLDKNIYVSNMRQISPTEAEKAHFRVKLSEQILQLTGQKPRIELKGDRISIHYK